MKHKKRYYVKTQIIYFTILTFTYFSAYPQEPSTLKLDPDLLVMLKECQNIHNQLGDNLYPN